MAWESGNGDTGLRFAMLGPLQVTRSGERLALGGRQQRAVLAVLLAEASAVVSVEHLADVLWGEQTPSGFVTTVQTYVFHLREVLEPGRHHGAAAKVLVTEAGGGYRLDTSGSTVDSAVFEASTLAGRDALEQGSYADASAELARGLGLWRGEVLADLADLGFVAPIATRLEEIRLVAQGLRMEAELALGRHVVAIPEIDRLIADHPMQEMFHAQRMLALYRSGRQSDALAAYRQLRSLLDEELGIEPSPPLQKLHRAVLRQDPALDWDPPVKPADPSGNGQGAGSVAAGSAEPAVPGLPAPGKNLPAPGKTGGRFRWRVPASRRRRVAAWALAGILALGASTALVIDLFLVKGLGVLPANTVGAIGQDGSIEAAVPVGTNPVGLAEGGGALWVANRSDGTVLRIDPRTSTVTQRFDVGVSPESLTTTADNVWVANFRDGTVTRINISANKVVATITVGTRPAAIASGRSGVWVANNGDNTIQRIDPISGLADTAIGVGDGPDGIAVDDGSVWVANGRDGTVSRIDPKTGVELSSPIRVGSGPKGIAVRGDDVWVANQFSTGVTRISRATGGAHSIEVGHETTSVVVAQGSVWVSEEFAAALTRIDSTTEALDRFPIGSSPRGLAVVGGSVWVASGAFTSPRHQGGTLTVAAQYLPGFNAIIDPAEVYDVQTLQPLRLVYDGLVASRFASLDASVLVPDLALALPEPSNGGKTYTFTLRPGIRYSTGRELRASDFVLGMRKALTLKQGRPDFFAGIVGGQRCVENPDSCVLSDGVVTDDASRRVTFHLTAADPDFLYKLAMFVFPAPPGTSLTAVTTPMPGTGPYRISEFTPNKTFTLERNIYFKRWSFAAQPDGYPDVIRWLKVSDDRAGADAVIHGRADVARVTFLPDRGDSKLQVDELEARYPTRVHSDLKTSLWFQYLNVTVPPFDNVKARQAVNYAVDRSRLVELFGGPSVAVETCQLLPQGFPSYSWHCPYTRGPPDGRYHGPDLKTAQDLVRASGTRGMPVTVQAVGGRLHSRLNVYFTQLLGQLGYKATLHEMPDVATSHVSPNDRLRDPQVQSGAFVADFLLASSFYESLVACDAPINVGEYCNRDLDQRASVATALRATDPAAALREWTQIDRTVADEAVIVPMVHMKDSWFVSARVGNFQTNEILGPLLSQVWVQ